KLERERVAAENEAKRQIAIEARRHADTVCTLNTRIDEALQALAGLISQRSNALRALIDTEVGNGDWLRKQLTRPVLTRALCNFGLHRVADVSPCAPTHNAPLASANKVLAGIGIAEPEPKPNGPIRRPLKNGGDDE